jgi:hypothetical protein
MSRATIAAEAMTEPEAKASGLHSWIRTVRETVDDAAWARFVDAVPKESQALLQHPPLAITWLPTRVLEPIWQRSTEILFGGDLERVAEVARRQLRADLSTIYRVFLRIATPKFVASRAAALYGTYFRNNGAMSVVAESDHSVDILVADVPNPTPYFYASLRGSIIGTIELTGVSEVRAVIVSGGNTARSCLFQATWR